MDQAGDIRASEQLDWQRLEQHLKENTSLQGTMTVQQFHGGHANLSYLIRFGDDEYVLRRPPFGRIAPGAHDMKREFTFLSHIHPYYPRAPKAFYYSDDKDIIGSEFLLMERRHGIVIRYEIPPEFKALENIESRISSALIQAHADLHNIDISTNSLDHLGKAEGFLERQLQGWKKRYQLSLEKENVAMQKFIDKLINTQPISQKITLIHNDFKLDNCQFAPDNPDVIQSVFDWDMATIGDPLFDFASSLVYWKDEFFGDALSDLLLKGDFPDKAKLKQEYFALTGLDDSRMAWYEAFAYWKSGVIARQLYVRFKQGDSKDKRMQKFAMIAEAFDQKAISLSQQF